MRNTILSLGPVLFTVTLTAQGVFSNKTQSVLEKVIQDYPNHFYNIKGELISQAVQTARYRSTLQLPGASSSTVTVCTAARNEGAGWTCVVLEADSFARAKAKFAEIYSQLSNSIVTLAAQKTYILTGQYEEPLAGKKMTRVFFSLLPGVGDMKKLKVELALCDEGKTWKIFLIVQDLDPRDEIAGTPPGF